MHIHEFDSGDAESLERYVDLAEFITGRDRPDGLPSPREYLRAAARRRSPELRVRRFLVRDEAGELVGCAALNLPRAKSAPAVVKPRVVPERRGRGLGRKLLGYLVDQVRRDGRDAVTADEAAAPCRGGADWRSSVGFARRAGFELALRSVERSLELTAENVARAERRRRTVAIESRGLELVSWSGPTPVEHVGDMARLRHVAEGEDRGGELVRRPEHEDVELLRQTELSRRELGEEQFTVAARRRDDGRLLACSVLIRRPGRSENGLVCTTATAPEQRRRGLAGVLKAESILRAGDALPGLRRIHAFNAEADTAIGALNEALGFRPLGFADVYRRRLKLRSAAEIDVSMVRKSD